MRFQAVTVVASAEKASYKPSFSYYHRVISTALPSCHVEINSVEFSAIATSHSPVKQSHNVICLKAI